MGSGGAPLGGGYTKQWEDMSPEEKQSYLEKQKQIKEANMRYIEEERKRKKNLIIAISIGIIVLIVALIIVIAIVCSGK